MKIYKLAEGRAPFYVDTMAQVEELQGKMFGEVHSISLLANPQTFSPMCVVRFESDATDYIFALSLMENR